MPHAALRPCNQPGCPALITKGSYCAQHSRQAEQARGSAAARGYDSKWRKKRAAYLRVHPLCVDPYGLHPHVVMAARVVDHMVPLEQGGKDDESNYQPLCDLCHNHKRATDDKRKG